jgi:hypothetical protein
VSVHLGNGVILDTRPRGTASKLPAEQILLKLWRTRGLNRVLNRAVAWAPGVIRQAVEDARARVRERELRQKIQRRARLVPEDELCDLLVRGLRTLAERHGRASLGDYLEFGVYNGTSMVCMHRAIEREGAHSMRLFGFDSFQGFPPSAAWEDEGRWQPGKCYSPLELTTAVLDAEGVDWSRLALVPGWFDDTLNEETVRRHGIEKASVIMIDCDLYSSTKTALNFCAPLIRDEALVLFDEWHAKGLEGKLLGERKAFEEFLREWGCFTAIPFGQYAKRTETFLVRRRPV